MTIADMDFETYSEAGYVWDETAAKWRVIPDAPSNCNSGIAAVGAAAYTLHESADILSLAYDLKDGLGPRLWMPLLPPPQDLFDYIQGGGLIEAFNATFEFLAWNNIAVQRYGWPELTLGALRCAMAKANAYGVSGRLGEIAAILGTPQQKDKRGQFLINKLSVPAGAPCSVGRRRTIHSDPALFDEMYAYNIQDIAAEADVSARLPEMLDSEIRIWQLDQRINRRGVQIDTQSLNNLISLHGDLMRKYGDELRTITGGAVASANSVMQVRNFLAARGVELPNLQAQTVEDWLANTPPGTDTVSRRVVELRSILGAASAKKLYALRRRLLPDGRVTDLFQYYGAERTGRFAGRGPQPQNMQAGGPSLWACLSCGVTHPSASQNTICECGNPVTAKVEWGMPGVEMALGDATPRSLPYFEKRWPDVLNTVGGCLRGLFVAAPGKQLVCSDFSSIEAVVAAMLAGEQWRIDVFRTHGKIYEMCAAKITGKTFEFYEQFLAENGHHHPDRKPYGKVPELASGYGGWINAWHNFGAQEFMNDVEIKAAILKWREASPAIVEMWGGQWRKHPDVWEWDQEYFGLEGAAVLAISNPGRTFTYNTISYTVRNNAMHCLLPSGRTLYYHDPALSESVAPHGHPQHQICYKGFNTDSTVGPRGWITMYTHGGKLFENVCQAVARDILCHSMLALEAAGYPIVLHVHDEIVSEVLKGFGSLAAFEGVMSTMPEWAKDWPIKARGGWVGERYRK